jgi:hypothetical protein
MACEGAPEQARRFFQEAWNARRDDYDAAIAAHYLARHQPTPLLTLDWNARAVIYCERIVDGRASELVPSLYLNLADSLFAVGRRAEARAVAERAAEHLTALPSDGYRSFIGLGLARLQEKLLAITPEVSPSLE